MARRYYNGAVRNLNIAIQSFPDVCRGPLSGLQRGAVLRARRPRAQAAAPQSRFREASHDRDSVTSHSRLLLLLAALRAGDRGRAHPAFHQRRHGRSATAISSSPKPSGSRPKGGRSGAASCATSRPSIRRPTARASRSAFEVAVGDARRRAEHFITETDGERRARAHRQRRPLVIPTGPHEYVIRYRTTRQIGFFDDYDELYWNATGTGWTFPIDGAEARITLPERGAVQADRVLHRPAGRAGQGRHGGRAAARPHRVPHHAAAAAAQRPDRRGRLAEGRGRAADSDAAGELLAARQSRAAIAASAAALLLLAYYFFAWLRVGRDPPTRHHHPAVRAAAGHVAGRRALSSTGWASTIAASRPSSISASTGT